MGAGLCSKIIGCFKIWFVSVPVGLAGIFHPLGMQFYYLRKSQRISFMAPIISPLNL
jgi:hypothetical protein